MGWAAMTWAFVDFYRPDLAWPWHLAPGLAWPTWPGPVENLAEIATEVITSALKCSEWRWVRAR